MDYKSTTDSLINSMIHHSNNVGGAAVAGSVIGFLFFVAMLEGPGSGNILWRNKQFRIRGLYNYLKSPFISKILWYRQVWIHNWIIMTLTGAISGGLTMLALNYLF